MINLRLKKKLRLSHLTARFIGLSVFVLLGATFGLANHPVFVEGNCLAAPPGTSGTIAVGTCGDYDGDGRIGTAEDTDGDNVFGTIRAAIGVNGVSNNGTVTIVTSGTFAEENITIEGNVTLQAAPGVEASIDAVLRGDFASANASRQAGTGVYIVTGGGQRVVLRNITIKNYRIGILTAGNASISIENVRLENNVDYGIKVVNSNVSIINSSVTATGFRNSAVGNYPATSAPAPGYGISFDDNARANIVSSTVSNNFARGISNNATGIICISQSSILNNGTSFVSTGTGTISFSGNGCYQ